VVMVGFPLSEAAWCKNEDGNKDSGTDVFHGTFQTSESVCLRRSGVNER